MKNKSIKKLVEILLLASVFVFLYVIFNVINDKSNSGYLIQFSAEDQKFVENKVPELPVNTNKHKFYVRSQNTNQTSFLNSTGNLNTDNILSNQYNSGNSTMAGKVDMSYNYINYLNKKEKDKSANNITPFGSSIALISGRSAQKQSNGSNIVAGFNRTFQRSNGMDNLFAVNNSSEDVIFVDPMTDPDESERVPVGSELVLIFFSIVYILIKRIHYYLSDIR